MYYRRYFLIQSFHSVSKEVPVCNTQKVNRNNILQTKKGKKEQTRGLTLEPFYRPKEETDSWDLILRLLRRSAIIKASSKDWEAFSLGSQCVWYLELRSSNVTVRDPPMHSVTFWPVISRCTPPGWLPSWSWTSKNALTSAWTGRNNKFKNF